ncbi:Cytochrome b561 [Salmonella enterica subsp. enterica]|uniref:Cytochrome b561 n=1 Tax=Salmonella enterica I TaxID=59201 RepID=A0A3S4FQ11_SALET|nr:Cytochrome b561 [Salmonella enterica subsp. enterica]
MGNKYSGLQIGIHWLVFFLVIVAYAAMELRGFAPRSYRPWFNMTHVSCGITILPFNGGALDYSAEISHAAHCSSPKTDDDRNGAFRTSGDLPVIYRAACYWSGHDV